MKSKESKIFSLSKLHFLVFAFFVFAPLNIFSQLVTINGNTNIFLNEGAILSIKGGVHITENASITHSNVDISNIYISGVFHNQGSYIQDDTGILRFFGDLQDTISGPSQTFEKLWIQKNNGSSMVTLADTTNVTIEDEVRLVSNNLLNINRADLTIEIGAMIYPDSVSTYVNDPLNDPFTPSKHITTSGEKFTGGQLIRKLAEIAKVDWNSDREVRFPLGTPLDTSNPTTRLYSPSRYVLIADRVFTGPNAYIGVECIAGEHPGVEVNEVSLKKYWRTAYNDVFVEPEGYSVRFNYNDEEVQGVEDLYLLTLLYRPFDGPNGTYYINPSVVGYGIEPINNRFYVDEVNAKDTLSGTLLLLDGEWTAGQEAAVSTFYYSRQDGDWNDLNTWSKQGYGGAPTPNLPSTINDIVFIGDGKSVTVNASTPDIKTINIEETGRLVIENKDAEIFGDSLFVRSGGTLAVSTEHGINNLADPGHIKTQFVDYSSEGIYEYVGVEEQVTGDGLPDIVGAIVINKATLTDTVALSKSVLLKDSMSIIQGAFHLHKVGNFTAQGETGDTTGRSINMYGGELIIPSFPTKYKNGVFDAGTITFFGTGSFRVPSSEAPAPGEPAVTQYNNLSLKGSRGANSFITLDPTGQIRIAGDFDISALTINPTPVAERFIVTGSTVVFNGDGDQSIPSGYASPVGLNYRLKYHNLNIAGTGNKNVQNPNDAVPAENFLLVRNNVNLVSGTLVSNNHHIKILNSWVTTPGGVFNAGNGLVTFEADGKVTTIQSNGIQFNNVRIMGTAANGYVSYIDSMTIAGNLEINPNFFRALNDSPLSIRGNFTNNGIFVPLNGRVYFNGVGDQTLTHNGNGNFYNLTVNKSSGNVLLEGDSTIKITNNLTLTQGNIGGRNSVSVSNKPLVVDGTITRTGATPGHVDGRLRLPTVENSFTRTFTIGLGNDYAPMKLDVNGFGGAAGYLDAFVVVDTDAPNITRAVIETQNPNGPELDSTKNVRKTWVLRAAQNSVPVFALAASRTYDVEFFFPASDTVGRGNALNFEVYQRAGDTNAGYWTRPNQDIRNPLSTKFTLNPNLANNVNHYFMLGDPKVFTYFSIGNGNWNDLNTWSTAGYNSIETVLRAPLPNDNIRIGNGRTVTLNVNHEVGANRLLTVESDGPTGENGHLVFETDARLITGAGTFRLDSGAAVTIRHADGIVNSGASGCVRTTTRQYNFNNHHRGNFVYARPTGTQNTGDGFPDRVQTLTINKTSGDLNFTGTSPVIRQVWDSLHITGGANAVLSNVIMKLGGNFRLGENATFNPGNTRNNQAFATTPPSTNSVDTLSLAGGFTFNGSATQYIEREGADTVAPIVFNRFSLSKQGGVLISKKNIECPQLIFHTVNRALLNLRSFNKYVNVYAASGAYNVLRVGRGGGSQGDPGIDSLEVAKYGWVNGRLIRLVSNSDGLRQWPLGTATEYTPIATWRNTGSNTGAVTGLIEIQAIDGNHPLFNAKADQMNPNTNIRRYYEITRPVGLTPAYVQGDRFLRTRFIFTQNEPRGGINPTSYSGFRLQADSNWTRTANMTTESNTSTDIYVRVNDPTLGGNNIFEAQSEFSNTTSITYMIGEPPPAVPERIFYSRGSGDWTDPDNWSYTAVAFDNTEDGYALNSNSVNDYPRRNDTNSKDHAYIGAGHRITMDTSNFQLALLQVEETPSGMGTLSMPNNNFVTTQQFIQKNGGKLEIGHQDGIVANSQTVGAIRAAAANSIINYDWNSFGINNFAYIRTDNNVQNTGSGLPSTVGSLTIDYGQSANNRYVNITNDANLTIKDSLVILNGRIRNRNGNRTLTVNGHIFNRSNDVGFHGGVSTHSNPSNRAVILNGAGNQFIYGSADSTVFPSNLTIDKTGGRVLADHNLRLDGTNTFTSNTIFELEDGITLTFGDAATLADIGTFGVNKNILVSGGANTASLRKTYPTGTGTSHTFTFPVAEDSTGLRGVRYGEARFALNSMDFSANNYLEFDLRSEYEHPNAVVSNPSMFTKYWSVRTANIARSAGTMDARFRYNDSERIGNILEYVPALYRRADITPEDPGWSLSIFDPTNLQIDTTNKFIIIEGAKTLPHHDWTAGEPSSFAQGKRYWSRGTGNWRNPTNWTNFENSGDPHNSSIPALNYPGYFANDTVMIGSNHIITFDRNLNFPVDSIAIGLTSPSTSPELRFDSQGGENKSITVSNSIDIGVNGLLSKDNSSGTSRDTVYVDKNIINNGGALRGVDIFGSANRFVTLVFDGASDSHIIGEGTYSSIGTVILSKADSVWNTINESQAFSTAFTNSILANSDVNFGLDAGMYVHNNPASITLSTDGDGDIFLGDRVGLTLFDGTVVFSDGLICGQNSSVWLIDGTMEIGNDEDENFLYESVTIIDIAGTSQLKVAGAMRRRFLTSSVDFRLKDNALIEVMLEGATTNSAERRGAFDFGEANSQFEMSGGRVIIYQPMKESIALEKDPDYFVATSTSTVTGGTVQFGDPNLSLTVEPFSLIASTPFWNLDVANTYGEDLFMSSPIVTVRNDLWVRDDAAINLSGNNLTIGGDFILDGEFRTGNVGSRRVSFNGRSTSNPPTQQDQTLSIKNAGNDPFYDLVIDKANGGSLILDNSVGYPESSPIIRNTLEFTNTNTGLITTGTDRFVQVGTAISDLASIQRFGAGHVNGELRRWINDGTQNRLFTVGDATSYTPAQIVTTAGTGTPGLLSVRMTSSSHPDIANNSFMLANTDIARYWSINPVGSTPFSLGALRKYDLTLFFRPGFAPAGDVKVGTTFGIFEHFRRNPSWNAPGDWFISQPETRTDSSTFCKNYEAFGDFVIGEIEGLRFYSSQTGNWNDIATWRNNSYAGPAATRTPNQQTDRVFVGNGHTVTIGGVNPRVRAIQVEEHNGLPGKLRIIDEKYLRGLTFAINANCFLVTDDAFGFTSVTGPTPNIGAIRTTSTRSYGQATYEYIAAIGQAIGDGPTNPKTILVNNTGTVNKTVSFSNATYTIEDTIRVNTGNLGLSNANVTMRGDIIMASGSINTTGNSTFTFAGTKNQNLILNDSSGLLFHNLRMNKTGGSLLIAGSSDSANIRVRRDLTFQAANTVNINARTNNRRVVLRDDTTTVTRTGSGHVDGKLSKRFGTGAASFTFPIGVGSVYTPSTITLSAGTGTAGQITAISYTPVTIDAGRVSPDKKINYYWSLQPWSGFTMGTRTIGTSFRFPSSEVANLTGGVPNNAQLMRKSFPTETPLWNFRTFAQSLWDVGTATAATNGIANDWAGLGEFYIGEKTSPTFYSRQNGDWNNNTTWTFNSTHIGDAVPVGEFPNPDPTNQEDNVYIGLNHIVQLNVAEPQLDTLVIRNDATLDMQTNAINCFDCAPAKGLFDMQNNSIIRFGGFAVPTTATTMKNFQIYQNSNTSTVEFYGEQTIPNNPFGFSAYQGNVRVSGVGEKNIATPVVINRNLFIDTPAILNVNANALEVRGNIENSSVLNNNQVIEIGE